MAIASPAPFHASNAKAEVVEFACFRCMCMLVQAVFGFRALVLFFTLMLCCCVAFVSFHVVMFCFCICVVRLFASSFVLFPALFVGSFDLSGFTSVMVVPFLR